MTNNISNYFIPLGRSCVYISCAIMCDDGQYVINLSPKHDYLTSNFNFSPYLLDQIATKPLPSLILTSLPVTQTLEATEKVTNPTCLLLMIAMTTDPRLHHLPSIIRMISSTLFRVMLLTGKMALTIA